MYTAVSKRTERKNEGGSKSTSDTSRIHAIDPVGGDFIVVCDRSRNNAALECQHSTFAAFVHDVSDLAHRSVPCDGPASKPMPHRSTTNWNSKGISFPSPLFINKSTCHPDVESEVLVILMLNLGSVFLYSHVEAKPQSFVVIVLCQFWCSLVFPTLFTITKRLYRDVTEEGKLLPRRKRSVPSKLREGLRLWLQGFPTCFFIGLFSMVMMELRTWSSTHWHWIIVGGGGRQIHLAMHAARGGRPFQPFPEFC